MNGDLMIVTEQDLETQLPAMDSLVAQRRDEEFLSRVQEIRRKRDEYIEFLNRQGSLTLSAVEIPDPTANLEQNWGTLLLLKETDPPYTFTMQELMGVHDPAQATRRIREADYHWGGASGKVAKISLSDGRDAALKVPTQDSHYHDLEIEKRALMRLSSLQGKGVVKLLGTLPWGAPNFALVKEWKEGKVLGLDLMPSWANLERTHQSDTESVESARLVLSLFEVLGKVHERKVLLGDSKRGDFIWDGQTVTLIDFAQAGLGNFDVNKKQWTARNFKDQSEFDSYLSAVELPSVLEDMFFPYTSLSSQLGEFSLSQLREAVGRTQNPVLRSIAESVMKKDYHNAAVVKSDLEGYFLSLGMTPGQLGINTPAHQ